MKKIYLMLAVAIFAISCNEDVYSFSDDDDDFTEFYLSDLSSSNYPTFDNWVIKDSSADTDDFDGFSGAILAISENYSSRKITISFPNLDEVPSYAIFGQEESIVDEFYTSCITSVSADVATRVGIHAFSSCTALTSVSFPAATNVEYAAFANCEKLTSYNLPVVDTIGSYMFAFCSSLESVSLPKVTTISSYSFMYCDALSSVSFPTAHTSGNYAFWDCNSLESISLPYLTTLGPATFYSCDLLSSIELPLVENVGSSAFGDCDSLLEISLPMASSIGDYAFLYCDALETVSIPEAIYLGYWMFEGCDALTNLEIATGSAQLYSVSADPFGSTPTEQINLTIGSVNAEFVDGNTLSVGDFVGEFASITVL